MAPLSTITRDNKNGAPHTAIQPLIPEATSLLILSDIHFGHLAEHRDFALSGTALADSLDYSISMRSNLVEVIQKESLNIDAILAPGDLTSAACPNEFEACWEIIQGFAKDLGVAKDRIFHTYGNHDCNWRVSRLAEGDATFLPDEGFRHIASRIGDLYCNHSESLTKGPIPGCGVSRSSAFDLFIANSGYFSTDDQKVKHGKLGIKQLEWLRDELTREPAPGRWRILMLHHHPYNYPYPVPVHDLSFLEEGDLLTELLGASRVDFVCHGHRHHPIIKTRIDAGWAAPVTFLCAGSVAVNAKHRSSGHIPNLFHIATLEGRHPTSQAALGKIRSFRFAIADGWVPTSESSKTVPIDPIHHFGSVLAETERLDLMSQVVETALSSMSQNLTRLPNWEDLPVDLRYSSLRSVNKVLTDAVTACGAILYNRYPNQPFLIRQ